MYNLCHKFFPVILSGNSPRNQQRKLVHKIVLLCHRRTITDCKLIYVLKFKRAHYKFFIMSRLVLPPLNKEANSETVVHTFQRPNKNGIIFHPTI
jgi:hypothetical protein